MTEERLFSIDDADAELDELRGRLPRLREARQRLIDTSERITSAVEIDGGGIEGSDWFRAQETLKRELLWLADRGILLRDPDTGLVDFPAERDGERVFLCWRLGEERVGWYHAERSGFSSRKPLSRYSSDGGAGDRRPRAPQVLRRRGGGRRRRSPCRPWGGVRPPRPERGGQDDGDRDPGGVSGRGTTARCRCSATIPHETSAELKRRIGIVLQSTGVDPFLTVAGDDRPIRRRSTRIPRPTDEVIELVGLGREARHAREQALGRPAAPAGRRDRAGRRPGAAVPGRTDHRVRPERAAERLASPAEPHVAREDDLADDPLHGRGAVPRATRRGDQGWRDRGRGPSRLARRQSGDEDEDRFPTARRDHGHARPRRVAACPTVPSRSPPTTPPARPTSSRGGRSNAGSRSRASRSRDRLSRTSTSS